MNSTSNSQQDNNSCRTYSWIGAIVAGVVVFLLALKWLSWGFFPSFFVGIVVFLVLGYALIHWFCSQSAQASAGSSTMAAASAASTAKQSRPEPVAAPAPAPAPAAVASAPVPKPKPTAPVATPAPKPAAAKPTAVKPAAAKPAAAKPEAAKPAAKAAPTEKPAEKPAPKAAAKPAAPKARLAGPRRGIADDLKMIKGVGPGIEKTLNGMGVFHFDQVAAWTDKELALVDESMPKFKGRAERDGWIEQARKLAAGEETEFSSRVKDGDVY